LRLRVLAGEGQLVTIIGEPGLGKSRLIEEFRARLGETPHTWVEWWSSQLLPNTPLHPIAEWGRLRFGGVDAPDERRFADLENTLRLIGLDAGEYAPLIAPLVDVPLPPDRAPKFPPEEMRRQQLAAFGHAAELAARTRNAPERYAAYYGQWMGSVGRGDLRAARGMAETLLREAEAEGRPTEMGVARRALGQTCFYLGDLVEARNHLERTICDYDPERDREARVRFGLDTGAAATSFLAVATWLMGEVERARRLSDQAIRRAGEIGHVPTAALVYGSRMSLDGTVKANRYRPFSASNPARRVGNL
jgi:hypothetical protein